MPYDAEIPSGTINGTNSIFTTSRPITGYPVLSVNGMLYHPSDLAFGFSWTANATVFTINQVPQTDDVVLIIYDKD